MDKRTTCFCALSNNINIDVEYFMVLKLVVQISSPYSGYCGLTGIALLDLIHILLVFALPSIQEYGLVIVNFG